MRRLLAVSVAVPALVLAATAWAQPYPAGPPSDEDPSYDSSYDPNVEPYQEPPGPDAGQPEYGDPDYGAPYAGPNDPYVSDPETAPGDDQGAPQYQPYESVPPSSRPAPSRSYGYSYRAPQTAMPVEAGVPADLVTREDRLERRIRSGETRGLVPPFHVDNLLVQLDSIRAQQEELADRDGGLTHTTRTFIESRLARLERNVTW